VERLSAGAELYDLTAPRIAVGRPADVCLVDLDARYVVGADGYVSRSSNSAFHGRTLQGQVLLTLAAGGIAYRRPTLVRGPERVG
jgi:dihydroorotase